MADETPITLGYDRGVSTGAETTYTDLYTVSAGVEPSKSSAIVEMVAMIVPHCRKPST